MPLADDFFDRFFTEGAKEIAWRYDLFDATRDLVFFDQSKDLTEDLNEIYELQLDLFEYVKLGRSLLGKRDLPANQEQVNGKKYTGEGV